jgi:hypothetical protein
LTVDESVEPANPCVVEANVNTDFLSGRFSQKDCTLCNRPNTCSGEIGTAEFTAYHGGNCYNARGRRCGQNLPRSTQLPYLRRVQSVD